MTLGNTAALDKKAFYASFFGLFTMLVLQNVITLGVNLADNIMLGAYSQDALSGVTAVNQIQFVFQQILLALGNGLVAVCSQYWGRGQTDPMKRISAVAMRTAVAVAVVLLLIVSCFPWWVVHLFTPDEAIIAQGVLYLRVIRFTYVFFAITQVLLATLRSVARVRIAFYLSVMTLVVNCCINYVLIFGRFGAPELGTTGAAIGTLAARILEVIVLLIYIAKTDNVLHLRLRDYFVFDRLLRKDYFRQTTPMLLSQGLWGVNTALQTVVLGHMTSAAIAANSAASNLYLIIKSASMGSSSAAAVMIGRAIGSGDQAQVRACSVQLQKTFVVVGLVSGVVLFFLRIPVLSLYELDPEARAMANAFLIILSVVAVTAAYQMPTNNGIVAGGGSPMFVVKMDLISIWGIVIPLSLIMAFGVKASPAVVVCCLNADQVFKCLPAWVKANRGHWAKKLTRDGV